MKRNILLTRLIIFLSLLINTAHAQTILKTDELNNWEFWDNMEKAKPANMTYKDGTPLKEGNYILEMRGDNKASLYVNKMGKIDGQISFSGLKPSMEIKMTFRNDTLVEYKKIRSGVILASAYLKGNIFYNKDSENTQYESEQRYRNGERIYSKNMNLSGWDIQDDIKGTREFYYGDSNIIQSRSTFKGLQPGIVSTEEEFDKKGILESKVIKYENGKVKTIKKDGSYEVLVPSAKGNDYIYQYSNKGKLLNKTEVVYPSIGF
ncbi:hypothetical protein ACFFLS_00745 [Flavobacterium procerum]|uniref:Antitoxin component YwqK of the YwqJK toxin-antitoxin module n=1 Tax=Flavobacterium procerum TaxID=1455569 RepID=A0ABV6BNA5_9FLAO